MDLNLFVIGMADIIDGLNSANWRSYGVVFQIMPLDTGMLLQEGGFRCTMVNST